MRRAQVAWLLIAAALVVAALAVPAALGAELLETLPAKVRPGTGASVGSVTYETLSGLRISCEKGTGTGEETSSKPPSGTFHNTATGCKSSIAGITVKCTGLGDATAGEVLLLGTWEAVFDRNPLTEALHTAALSSLQAAHLTCAGFVLVVIEGTRLCSAVNPTVKAKTHELKCEEEKGDPKDVKYWTAADVEKTAELKQKIGTEAAEKGAEQATLTVTTTEETFADQ
jgi:hypothetical protein